MGVALVNQALRNYSEITHDNAKPASAKLACLNVHLQYQKILT